MSNDYAPAVDTTWRRTPRILELAAFIESGMMLMPDEVGELVTLVRDLLARPVPDETVNVGYTVRHVIDGKPAEPGYLRSWLVAAEREDGHWVTWNAYTQDGTRAGHLAYDAGNYFGSADLASNKRRALRDLADRAGVPVATVNMDADEAHSQLMSRYRPYLLDFKQARELIDRADAAPDTEVSKGKAGLTAYRTSGGAMRYDLRERGL